MTKLNSAHAAGAAQARADDAKLEGAGLAQRSTTHGDRTRGTGNRGNAVHVENAQAAQNNSYFGNNDKRADYRR